MVIRRSRTEETGSLTGSMMGVLNTVCEDNRLRITETLNTRESESDLAARRTGKSDALPRETFVIEWTNLNSAEHTTIHDEVIARRFTGQTGWTRPGAGSDTPHRIRENYQATAIAAGLFNVRLELVGLPVTP